jgi:hypothetical protein
MKRTAKTKIIPARMSGPAPEKRKQWSFAAWANVLVCGTFLIFTGAVSYYSWKTVEKSKLTDSWSIMFLEMEKFAIDLDEIPAKTDATNAKTFLWDESTDVLTNIDVSEPRSLKPADLGFDGFKEINPSTSYILTIGGVPHLLRTSKGSPNPAVPNPGQQFVFQPVQRSQFSMPTGGLKNTGLIYIANKQGQLVYATKKQITPANFAARPLVQKFINSALSRGQMEFVNETATATFGFFYEVPKSNLVVFSEIDRELVLKPLDQLRRKLILLLLGSFLVVFLLLQYPLKRITLSLNLLVNYMRHHLSGYHFEKLPPLPSREIKELATLVQNWSEKVDLTLKSERQSIVDHYQRTQLEERVKYHELVNERLNTCAHPNASLPIRIWQHSWTGKRWSGQICRGFQSLKTEEYCLLQMKLYTSDRTKPSLTAIVHSWLNRIDVFGALRPDLLQVTLGELLRELSKTFKEPVCLSWSVLFFDQAGTATMSQSSGFRTITVDEKGNVIRRRANRLPLLSVSSLSSLTQEEWAGSWVVMELNRKERLLAVDDSLFRTSASFPRGFPFRRLTKALNLAARQSDFGATLKRQLEDHFKNEGPTDNYLCIVEAVSGA